MFTWVLFSKYNYFKSWARRVRYKDIEIKMKIWLGTVSSHGRKMYSRLKVIKKRTK